MKPIYKLIYAVLAFVIFFLIFNFFIESLSPKDSLDEKWGLLFPLALLIFGFTLYKLVNVKTSYETNPAMSALRFVVGIILLAGALPANNLLPLANGGIRFGIAALMVVVGIWLIISAKILNPNNHKNINKTKAAKKR